MLDEIILQIRFITAQSPSLIGPAPCGELTPRAEADLTAKSQRFKNARIS